MVYSANLGHVFTNQHLSQQCKAEYQRTPSHSRAPVRCNASMNRRSSLVALTIAAPLIATDNPTLAAPAPPLPSQSSSQATDLSTITDRVYLDIGVCSGATKQNRTLGDKSVLCSDPVSLGRLNINLFGIAAPGTVTNFKTLISTGALNGTQFSKILPGQWLTAGKQGSKRLGFLEVPPDLINAPNPDLLNPSAFKLRHTRPGTLSLNLSENEDDDSIRLRPGYKALSFIITAGPGAVALDGENIVFGQVEGGASGGLDVISAICSVPTFSPSENMMNYNKFASLLGDDRAEKVRKTWGRPLKAVVITGSGLL